MADTYTSVTEMRKAIEQADPVVRRHGRHMVLLCFSLTRRCTQTSAGRLKDILERLSSENITVDVLKVRQG